MGMKTKKNILLWLSGCLLVLFFQNCGDFGVQHDAIYQQSLYDYQENLDNTYLPKLLTSPNLTTWGRVNQSRIVDSPLFADQVSMVIAADRTASGNLIQVRSGPGTEEAVISINSGKIRVSRQNTTGTSYHEYKEVILPPGESKMVIAAAFGVKTSDIRFQVDGRVMTSDVSKTGMPFDYSFTSKEILTTPATGQVYEYVVFGGDSLENEGKLSGQELNVMSRKIANANGISNVVFDPKILDDTTDEDNQPVIKDSPEFLAAKSIFEAKCTSCHMAGGNSPNLVGLTEAKALNSGWVVKGNPQKSSLYYWLKGAIADTGPKSMPKGGSISAAEVQKIADWINSIP